MFNNLKYTIMNYRKSIEEKFRKYQAILGDYATDRSECKINLEEISNDFCLIDPDFVISIRKVPVKGDDVFYTIRLGDDKWKDVRVPLTALTDDQLSFTVEVMRKAMIIEELRNTFVKDGEK